LRLAQIRESANDAFEEDRSKQANLNTDKTARFKKTHTQCKCHGAVCGNLDAKLSGCPRNASLIDTGGRDGTALTREAGEGEKPAGCRLHVYARPGMRALLRSSNASNAMNYKLFDNLSQTKKRRQSCRFAARLPTKPAAICDICG
jgi:hypothetical protein